MPAIPLEPFPVRLVAPSGRIPACFGHFPVIIVGYPLDIFRGVRSFKERRRVCGVGDGARGRRPNRRMQERMFA